MYAHAISANIWCAGSCTNEGESTNMAINNTSAFIHILVLLISGTSIYFQTQHEKKTHEAICLRSNSYYQIQHTL